MKLNRNGYIILTIVIALCLAGIYFFFQLRNAESGSGGTNTQNEEPNGNASSDPLSRLFSQQGNQDDAQERIRRRTLTPEERKENEREFKLMREKIPGNLYIPGELSKEEQKNRRKILRDIIVYGNKVRKGTATPEQKKRYYELKKREVSDKIEFADYVLNRVKEKIKEKGNTNQYMDESTMNKHNDAIKRLHEEMEGYDQELKKI